MGKLRLGKHKWNSFKWKPAVVTALEGKIHLFWFTVPLFLHWMLSSFGEHLHPTLLNLPWYFHSLHWDLGFHPRECINFQMYYLLITLAQKTSRGFWPLLTHWDEDLETKESSEIDGELLGPYKHPRAKGEPVTDSIWASKYHQTEVKPVELGLKSTWGGDDASTRVTDLDNYKHFIDSSALILQKKPTPRQGTLRGFSSAVFLKLNCAQESGDLLKSRPWFSRSGVSLGLCIS